MARRTPPRDLALRLVIHLGLVVIGVWLVRSGFLAGLPVVDMNGAVVEQRTPGMFRIIAGAALVITGLIGGGVAISDRVRASVDLRVRR